MQIGYHFIRFRLYLLSRSTQNDYTKKVSDLSLEFENELAEAGEAPSTSRKINTKSFNILLCTALLKRAGLKSPSQ